MQLPVQHKVAYREKKSVTVISNNNKNREIILYANNIILEKDMFILHMNVYLNLC